VEQIVAVVEREIPSIEFDAEYSAIQLPTVSFLPQRYVFQGGAGGEGGAGLPVVVRSASKADMPALYAVMRAVADTGQGYGIDEFPTLNAFRAMTADSYNIVVEEDSPSRKVTRQLFQRRPV